MSYYRRGEHKPVKTGRAARIRVGNHMSVARRQAVLAAVADRHNTGKTTAAQYLADVIGADEAFVHSYASPYGKACAKVYREQFGAEPQRCGLAVRGRRLVAVLAYSEDELPVLAKGAAEYRRTAELLASEPTAAPDASIQAPSAPLEGIAPAALVAELAERHALPAGFTTARVEAILDGMRGNPRLLDQGTLTPGGAAVVRSILYAEDVEGMLRREARAWQDETRVLAAA